MRNRIVGYGFGIVVVGLLGAAGMSRALLPTVDVPLDGSRAQLVDGGPPAGRRNLVGFVDANVVTDGIDPRVSGATAFVGRVGDGSVTILDLPARGWGLMSAGSRKDYRFRSRTGPVVRARLVDGRSLRFSAHGLGAYGLDGAPQQAVGVIVEIGAVRFCGLFGGAVTRDDGTVFLARRAPAPAACPVLGTTTTTTTSPTSSTTTTGMESSTTTAESMTSTTTVTTTTTESTVTTTTSTTTSATATTSTTGSTTTTTPTCRDDFDCDETHVCRNGACVPCLAFGEPCDGSGNGTPCCRDTGCNDQVPVFCRLGEGFCCHD